MQTILKRINRIPGVYGTVIIGEDGLVMASDIAGNDDPQALGAVASGIASTLTAALRRMGHGSVSRFVINGDKGCVVLLSAGEAIILTLVKKEANMGMVLVELKESAREVAQQFSN